MQIVNPNLLSNSLRVLPRYYATISTDVSVSITNEDNRKVVTQNITNLLLDDGFLSFDTDASFIENSSYKIKIVENVLNEVIFRGKLFSTDQSKQNYSING